MDVPVPFSEWLDDNGYRLVDWQTLPPKRIEVSLNEYASTCEVYGTACTTSSRPCSALAWAWRNEDARPAVLEGSTAVTAGSLTAVHFVSQELSPDLVYERRGFFPSFSTSLFFGHCRAEASVNFFRSMPADVNRVQS